MNRLRNIAGMGVVLLSMAGGQTLADPGDDKQNSHDPGKPEVVFPGSCRELPRVGGAPGDYTVVAVERYRGGLTSADAARARLGAEVSLRPEHFSRQGTDHPAPKYVWRCTEPVVEGEVPAARYSNFYGYAPERTQIQLLEVYLKAQSPEPDLVFEIHENQLWLLEDGWLYRLEPTGS